ncbi:MAG TPA: GFA family protein [Novosphingobium sp.]|nr:GFA family protein [Novosphingobium sp.]
MGTGACHCRDCQKFTGGGPNYVALLPKGSVTLTRGEPSLARARADSGTMTSRAFCADCGTHLWGMPEHAPFMTVKVGAFDSSNDLGPQMHIYTASAPAWHPVPGEAPCFAGMPPMDARAD